MLNNLNDLDMVKDAIRSRKIGIRGDCPTCKDVAGINEELILLLEQIANRQHIGDASDLAKRALDILLTYP
jgi:hypothetical protein